VLTKVRHDLFPDESASADDNDFHGCPLAAPSVAELVIRSTGAGLFITAAGHVISGAGLSITAPIALFRSVRSTYHGVRCLLPCDPHQLKRPVNHPSFNEVFNLRSRGQRPARYSMGWHGRRICMSVPYRRLPNSPGRRRMPWLRAFCPCHRRLSWRHSRGGCWTRSRKPHDNAWNNGYNGC